MTWWRFGVLDDSHPNMVDFLVERGAVVDVQAAARLGMPDKLKELVAAECDLFGPVAGPAVSFNRTLRNNPLGG